MNAERDKQGENDTEARDVRRRKREGGQRRRKRETLEFGPSVEVILRQCFKVVFYRGRIICVS